MGAGCRILAPVKVKVLSWNIDGYEDIPEAKNLLVSLVVSQLNPDVLLLQGLPSQLDPNQRTPSQQIVDHIIEQCQQDHDRQYNCVNAGMQNMARLLYDRQLFRAVQEHDVGEIVGGEGIEDGAPYSQRAVAVQLQHIATTNMIIFVSFCNVNRECQWPVPIRLATTFCNSVSVLRTRLNMPVVAGVTLNFDPRFLSHVDLPAVDVPECIHISRRERFYVRNYFMSASPDDIRVDGDVSAVLVDIFQSLVQEPGVHHLFHQVFVFQKLLEEFPHIRLESFMRCLFHDPLVYDITCVSNII